MVSRRLSPSAPTPQHRLLIPNQPSTHGADHHVGCRRRILQCHARCKCRLSHAICLLAGFFNNGLYPILSSSGFLISDPRSHDPFPGLVPALAHRIRDMAGDSPADQVISYLQREVILPSERLGRLWPRPGWWSECGHSRSCPSSSDIDHVAVQTVQLRRVLLRWKQEVSAVADLILVHIQVFRCLALLPLLHYCQVDGHRPPNSLRVFRRLFDQGNVGALSYLLKFTEAWESRILNTT